MRLAPAIRKRLGRWITGLGFALGLVLFWRLLAEVGWERIEAVLANLTARDLGILLALPVLTIILLSGRLYLVLRALGWPVPFPVVTAFSMAGTSLSNLLPGGEVTDLATRALLLGRSGVPTDISVLAVVIDGFIRFAVNTVLLFVVSAYLLISGFEEVAARTTLLVGTGIAFALLVGFGVVLSQGTAQWFIRTAGRLGRSREEGVIAQSEQRFVDFFKRLHPLSAAAFLLTVLGFFWEPLQITIILNLLDVPLPFWQAFWLYHALLFPRLIPIPAGLGVSEGGGALFSALVGQGAGLGVTVGLLSRIRTLPYILLGLLVLPVAGFIKIRPKRT